MKGKRILSSGWVWLVLMASFFTMSCSNAVYTHQNGTYYNDWEAVHHHKVQNASKKKKVKSQSKAPNWKRYNTQTKLRMF